MKAVILANGEFPSHPKPLNELLHAPLLVCCDGAIEYLEQVAITPNALVGDLDSVKEHLKRKYESILYYDPDQNSNDLTKSVRWCLNQRITNIVVVGATGKREDHTLGNIGLLSSYARMGANIVMLTDTGTFRPLLASTRLDSYPGQQVSIFSPSNQTVVYTKNLKYPLVNQPLPELWMGTLNESLDDWFELTFSPGPLIVYQKY